MSILVTGGAGYIGTHTCVELLNSGKVVVVVDTLCNSKREALARVERITGKKVVFFEVDIRDRLGLEKVFSAHNIKSVIHFAGLKAVGESGQIPLSYYDHNVHGSLVLLQTMEKFKCFNIVFSSSATVYGASARPPYVESMEANPSNVYGRTKLVIENILKDLCSVPLSSWRVIILRYFNPIGAHESGLIGEDPKGIPNNLVPYIAQVCVGKREVLQVFGNDWPTRDGTGIRDFIHVVDLARGHVLAVDKMETMGTGWQVYNLGRGTGCSVLEVLKAFELECGKQVPYEFKPRRTGDLPEVIADVTLAKIGLGWCAELNLERMVRDSWRWQSHNPDGYDK